MISYPPLLRNHDRALKPSNIQAPVGETLLILMNTLFAVAIDQLDPDHVIAVDDQGEVFASRDGGISWSNE